jgi:arginine decarboxylase
VIKLETSFSSHSAKLSERNISATANEHLAQPGTLSSALSRHRQIERASFHTPGHKNRQLNQSDSSCIQQFGAFEFDLTELPELDQLSYPDGILKTLESRAAGLWSSQESIISVNGASAGLTAAMLSLSSYGQIVLVPRNAHRSIIQGLVLSGLKPFWYDPQWHEDWELFGQVKPETLSMALAKNPVSLAGVVVVSPTYAGSISDLKSLSKLCREREIPLIVDEAHGAHLLESSALSSGADIVVHSLHKTLSALTQTGIIHIAKNSRVDGDLVRANLRLLQSTSPSYPLMLSIEQAITEITGTSGREKVAQTIELSKKCAKEIESLSEFTIFSKNTQSNCDALHILLKHQSTNCHILNTFLTARGIYTETILGNGLLLLLGMGSTLHDVETLIEALVEFKATHKNTSPELHTSIDTITQTLSQLTIESVLPPREASLLPSHSIPLSEAEGLIAAECIAPCPPGVALCIPGQKITQSVLQLLSEHSSLQHVRVLNRDPKPKSSNQAGDTNTNR